MRHPVNVHECSGLCCAAFPIGEWSSYARVISTPEKVREGELLARILVPLRRDDSNGNPLFTCAWWDAETRQCTRYDERPEMCRGYPYGSACEHCGSTGEEISTG